MNQQDEKGTLKGDNRIRTSKENDFHSKNSRTGFGEIDEVHKYIYKDDAFHKLPNKNENCRISYYTIKQFCQKKIMPEKT